MPKIKSNLYLVNPGVVTQLLSFGYKVYKLPEAESACLQKESLLLEGSSDHYIVFKASLAKDILSNTEPLDKVNKLATEEISASVMKAIKTAYLPGFAETPVAQYGLVDMVLATQKIRVVYQSSMSLLSIIKLGS